MFRRVWLCFTLAAFLPPLLGGCAALSGLVGGGTSKNSPLKPSDKGYRDPGPWAGPLAQKYAGQVLFSSAPIAKTDTDDTSVYREYELGAPLYIRFFAKESPANLLPECSRRRVIFRADVNGQYTGQSSSNVDSFGGFEIGQEIVATRGAHVLTGDTNRSFATPTVWRAKDEDEANETISKFNTLVIRKLRDGENMLRVLIDLDCGATTSDNPLYAEGSLKIIVKPGAKADYIARYGTQIEPSPHPQNTTLVPEIIAAMKSQPDWNDVDILGASVISPSWVPIRNELTGALVSKRIEAVVIEHPKKETDPEYCRLHGIGFQRDAAGGPLYYGGLSSDISWRNFFCSKAPK